MKLIDSIRMKPNAPPTSPRPRWPALLFAAFAALAFAAGLAFDRIVIPHILATATPSKLSPTLLQTLELRAWTAYGAGIALGLFAFAALFARITTIRPAAWLAIAVTLAAALRFATPEMAFNSIVRPDGVHFSIVAQRLVSEGKLTVPTGNAELPARTLPGESFIQALTQWTDPAHPGQGIYAVGLASLMTLLVAARITRRIGNTTAMWWALGLIALSPLHAWYARQLMSEIPWGLSVLAACGMIAIGRDKPSWLFVAGLISGLGLAFKSSHLLIVLATLAGAVLAWPGRPRVRWRGGAALLLGMALGAIPAFYYNHAALGGWLRTAYHVYWPGWASATEALHVKYLWSAPLIKGSMGNVPYYLMAFLGLDLRPERMPLLPGLLLALIVLAWRRTRHDTRQPDACTLFVRMTIWIALVYGAGCFLYSFQDPRFLLPVVPLVFTGLALRLGRTTALPAHPLASLAGATLVAALVGLGIAIVKVESFGTRVPERQLLQELAEATRDFDIVVADEDPVLLTTFGVWTGQTRVLPMLLPDELWFPEDPAAWFAAHAVAVKPFPGTVEQVTAALREGRQVACYIRRPHDRPEAWTRFNEAFLLTPLSHLHLPWLHRVTLKETAREPAESPTDNTTTDDASKPAEQSDALPAPLDTRRPATFTRGMAMPEGVIARERSLPVHPVTVSPYELAATETSWADFLPFLRDQLERGAGLVRTNQAIIDVQWLVDSNTSLTICQLDPLEPNVGVAYEARSNTFVAIAGKLDLPVVQVTWDGAALYANWLSQQQQRTPVYVLQEDGTWAADLSADGWRLSTEAEWEAAATWDGHHKRIYAWGDTWQPTAGNVAESPRPARADTDPLTVPVNRPAPWTSTTPAPGQPLHLTGNVWEWCHDWFEEYREGPLTDPSGPATGTVKVVRGGSYRTYAESGWSAFRGIAPPDIATPDIGFRLARTRRE